MYESELRWSTPKKIAALNDTYVNNISLIFFLGTDTIPFDTLSEMIALTKSISEVSSIS